MGTYVLDGYIKGDILMKVELSSAAVKSLDSIIRNNKNLGARIFGQLKHRLPLDPYPDVNDKNDLFQAELVEFLEKEGIDVYRLKSREFLGHRVFYIVDEEADLIYVLDIVKRTEDTYKRGSTHIQSIKQLYFEYYTDKTNRGGK